MKRRVLITGGCGFIGTNASIAFAEAGYEVLALDNFSRPTGRLNAEVLSTLDHIEIQELDICKKDKLEKIVRIFNPTTVIHLAAQVAVTTSISNPTLDFNSNLVGSFNLLESLRAIDKVRVVLASTNKVYGNLDSVELSLGSSRYAYANSNYLGTPETQEFDPHSPYGCSKGAADKYFSDYHRSFGLDTVVLRQSCIYGKRQFGVEDQGWIAWFMISALKGLEVTVYGDGRQVRDALYVDDLCQLYLKIAESDSFSNRTFNIGGGIENSISVIELLEWIKSNFASNLSWRFDLERLGDQKIFISDNSSIDREIAWKPSTSLNEGLKETWHWLRKQFGSEKS